jgi:hypothetical protein
MSRTFEDIISTFPERMRELTERPPIPVSGLENIPVQGIYVFYENGKAIYVGRSRNLKQRFRQHRQQSSDHHSATFAFMIARQDAEKAGVNVERTRDDLEKDSIFSRYFSEAKKRVSDMQVQVLSMDDPIEQTLFEVYAALDLKTEYNTWDTH